MSYAGTESTLGPGIILYIVINCIYSSKNVTACSELVGVKQYSRIVADRIRDSPAPLGYVVFYIGKDLQTLNRHNNLALWAGQLSECINSVQNVNARVGRMMSVSRPANGNGGCLSWL